MNLRICKDGLKKGTTKKIFLHNTMGSFVLLCFCLSISVARKH